MKRIKKPRHVRIWNGLLKNDLEYVDRLTLRSKIHEQSRFSILYFTLLITSVFVCTLGLLMNSSAIVIGGMLIAPLMWPLARLGYGVAHREFHQLYRGGLLVLASIIIGALSAFLITWISPIKVVNAEILARTTPTLMDLFVAIAAGLVAAIGITQRKIADSLAGVAIAVSLMPPLCTVGIALGLRNLDYSVGALLLFAVNAASITMVTTIVLILTQYARKERVRIATRAMLVNVIFIVILAIPLVQFLRSYSLEVRSFTVASSEMDNFIERKSTAAAFENIQVVQRDQDTLTVSADLLLPRDIEFTYEDNEDLVAILEQAIEKDVLLNLRIQSIIEPITKNQQENEARIEQLHSTFEAGLKDIESSYRISSININQIDEQWTVTADVFSNPETAPVSSDISELGDNLTTMFGETVELNLTFLPRLTLRTSEQTVAEEARKVIEHATTSVDGSALVSSFNVTEASGQQRISYTITTSNTEAFSDAYLVTIRERVSELFGDQSLQLQVRLLQAVDISS